MLIIFAVLFGLFHEAFSVYRLSGNPEHVVLGDNVTVTLTCTREDTRKYVTWSKDTISVAIIRRECEAESGSDNTYTYTCDLVNNIYYLHIPPAAITVGIQNVKWQCLPFTGTSSNMWSLTLSVPVTTVTITPAGDNKVVDIIEGETKTFTCTTGSSRPAACIQWYIGGQNVTNQATPQPPQQDGDKFISSSSLVYTGTDVDHNKVIYCEAVNIEGRQKVKSSEKSLFIQYKQSTSACIYIYLMPVPNLKYHIFYRKCKTQFGEMRYLENVFLHSRLVLILNMANITTFCLIFALRNDIHFSV